ncbi:MAG: radical SAM protein [Nanoarchaeota archaeon]|nr:radical SAM protein [Nanoarchaeota archaeon]
MLRLKLKFNESHVDETAKNKDVALKGCIFWNITNKCNNRCFYCFSSSGNMKNKELSTKEALNFIKEAADYGVPRFVISGGEPFIRKDIWTLLKEMRNYNLQIKIASNCTLLNKEKINKLDKMGVMSIQTPLDTLDRNLYAKIKNTNPKQFDKVIKNINLINQTNIHNIVSCVLTKVNADGPSQLMKFCHDKNIDTLSIFQPIPTGCCSLEKLFSIPEYLVKMKEIIDEFISYDKKWLIDIEGPTFESYDWLKRYSKYIRVNFAGCKAGRRICAISADGNLIPCPCMDLPVFYEGNIRERSLKDIWENGFKLFREPPRGCEQCKKYNSCMGGCRILAYGYTHKTNGMDPTCFKLNQDTSKKLEKINV